MVQSQLIGTVVSDSRYAGPERFPRWAKTGYLHPAQARIALQLMIASGYDQHRTNAAFEGPIRRATDQIWEY